MKLCITAGGNSLAAQTDNSFGRAPWLLIVDTDAQAVIDAIENSGVNASQGAGIAAAQVVADRGAQGVLTGRVGPKAQAALQAAGVKIYENIKPGTVGEALGQFTAGQYQQATGSPAGCGAGCGSGKGGGRGKGRGQGRRGGM